MIKDVDAFVCPIAFQIFHSSIELQVLLHSPRTLRKKISQKVSTEDQS